MRNLVKIYKALSDPNRVRILKMLEKRSLCVCEMTSILNLATSTVSKHLAILREADLIVDFKEGKWVNYRLNNSGETPYVDGILTQLGNWLNEDGTVKEDVSRVGTVDRNQICGVN